MSSRPHGRGMRGHHHNYRGGHWLSRGGHRGGRSDYHHPHHRSHSPRPGPRHPDTEKLLASLGPDAQLALTTAIINSVLKNSEDKEGRGQFRDNREPNYRHRDIRREGRGSYYREEMRPRRPYGEPRRYDSRWHNEEGRGHHFEREKVIAGPPHHQYGNRYPPGPIKRRSSPHSHPGPTYKRQRMEKLDPCEGDRESHRDLDYLDEDGVDDLDRPRERERHSSASEGESGGQDGGSDCENLASESGPSGVQVTIRADGERAVNSDGHVRRVAGRLFVELRCPYCRNQKSITFKEYKMHLVSPEHKAQLDRLANRHAQVLRKMRIQQRQEQKEIEDKWREENPEEFKNTISRFCKSCSLAFKCLRRNSNEGLSLHNRSKFHKMQRHYIHPRCGLCHIGFPSRMDYKRHLASIYHLRVRASNIDNQGRSQQPEDHAHKDEGSDLDLDNFMTLDSVGEDDENNGSEHEEITGDLDATEAQEKERAGAEDGDEDDLESVSAHSNTDKPSPASKEEKDAFHCKQRDKALHRGEEEEEEEEEDNTLEADWEKDQPDDEEEEGHQSLGTEYVRRIEAYYCSLCDKIIRANSSLGSRAVQRHCRSFSHLSHYRDHHPAPHQDEDGLSGEDGEGEDLQEDPHQAKLWEEVDKGLTALQGEILTEIENEDAIEGNKEANEVKKEGNESQEEDMEDSKVESNVTESLKEQRVGNGNMGSDSNAEDWEEAGEDITA